jgi:hypothetical protein
VVTMEENRERTSKVIRISQEHYDELLSLGRMNMTFDQVLDNVMEKVKLMGASAKKEKQ